MVNGQPCLPGTGFLTGGYACYTVEAAVQTGKLKSWLFTHLK
jgi:hypothetical protein